MCIFLLKPFDLAHNSCSRPRGRCSVLLAGDSTVCAQSVSNSRVTSSLTDLLPSCRGTALATQNAQQFGQGTGRIWLSSVNCPAGAEDFFDCPTAGFGNTGSCSHFNDAGVVCNAQPQEGASCVQSHTHV